MSVRTGVLVTSTTHSGHLILTVHINTRLELCEFVCVRTTGVGGSVCIDGATQEKRWEKESGKIRKGGREGGRDKER